jgi:hypothetical protein
VHDSIRAAKGTAYDTLDKASDDVAQLKRNATPALRDMAAQAQDLADRGMDSLREMSEWSMDYVAESAKMVKAYAKDEPIKAMLIAAAAGAALMAIARLLTRSRD